MVTSAKQIEITGFVTCSRLKARGAVVFIIDTGSNVSGIGEKDLSGMGLRFKNLERYTGRPVVVIGGGTVETRVLRDPVVILGIDTGYEKIILMNELLVHKGKRKMKRVRKGPMVYEKEIVHRSPSILGMDLLEKLKMRLVVDAARKVAYLED